MRKTYSFFQLSSVLLCVLGCLVFFACGKEDTPTPSVMYTVTFDTRGGDAVGAVKVEKGKTLTRPTDPKKGDSVLENWYTSSSLTTAFDFSKEITSDTTLYAKWAKKVSVTFHTRGGTEVASQSLAVGQKTSKPSPDPKKGDSVLENWYTSSSLTTAFDFNSAITSDMTLYAKWVQQTFTVTFNVGTTGIGAVPTQTVVKNAKVTRPARPTITQDKKVLLWYKEATFQTAFDFNKDTITSSITLYANWADATLSNIALAGYLPSGNMADALTQSALQSYAGTGASVVPVYVKLGGTGDGSSWSSAKGDVKTAIDAITDASDNKVYLVLVASGVYKAGSPIVMKNNVTIIGGWSSAGDWSRGQSDTTVLDGNKAYTVINNDKNGLTNKAVLYGVTVSNGYNNDKGGGMYNASSSPLLTNVVFSGNSANYGGGMYNFGSSPVLTNVVFSGNSANTGGGMINVRSSPVLTNVVFSGNNSADRGGGMYNYLSSLVLMNVVFSGNSAKDGGGIYNDNDGEVPRIVNSIFWGNTASAAGAQIYIYNDGSSSENLSLYNSVVQGGFGTSIPTSGVSITSLSGGGIVSGGGAPITINHARVLTTDPLLSPLANNGGSVQTMALGANSSAINNGLYIKRKGDTYYYSANNTAWYSDPALTIAATPPSDAIDLTATDARGYRRVGIPDIGAYEYGAQ